MRTVRRLGVGVLAGAILLSAGRSASAQLLKYVRDDALAVVKLNNAQAISDKAAAMAQKMGLANLNPAFADPIGLLKERLNLKAGVDFKGEAAVVIFRPPAGENEPRAMALIPVSDYKAFLGNFQNVKKDGEADTFSIQADGEPVFAEQWGTFAAVTPWKDLLQEQPTGLKVTGIIQKQLAEKDLTVYVNMKTVKEMILPQVQGIKQMVANMPMGQPAGAANQEAFQRAMAVQMFDGFEAFLNECQATALSLNLAPAGVATTLAMDFIPDSAMGKGVAGIQNTEGELIGALPKDKYLMFGGWSGNGAGLWEMVKTIYDKPMKATPLPEADAKAVADVLAATQQMLTSMKSVAGGLLPPPAGAGLTQGVIHAVAVTNGDAKLMMEAQRKSMAGQDALMKATGVAGIETKVTSKPAAKTIDGVALDEYQMAFTIDPKTPQAAVMGQFIQALYGQAMTTYTGAVNDTMLVSGVSVDEAKMQALIAAAKQNQNAMGNLEAVKIASEQLPKKRAAVFYVAVDNIVTLAFDIAAQMGQAVPLKVPQDLPPVGISLGSEGSTLRIDANIPSTLIENGVSMGIQAAMQQQQRRRARGGAGGQP